MITIHGRSRYPGLYAWTRNGEKFRVNVPEGCMLIQAGKELEYLTGGHIKAGFHEVVFDENTQKTLDKRKKEQPNRKHFWRVSSTLFSHIRTDHTLQVVDK